MENEKRTIKGAGGIPAAALIVLLATLLTLEERVHVPYRDPVGIWTVCEGITGPDVVQGKRYTDKECDGLTQRYIARMATQIGKCIEPGELAEHEWVAWGSFSYNNGGHGFCRSTAARLIREGKNAQACKQIPRFVYAGKLPNGKPRDCRIRANNCRGIVTRRYYELAMCEGKIK